MSFIKQTNFEMYMHDAVQLDCILYHRDQSSVSKKAAYEVELTEKWNSNLQGQYSSGQNYASFIYLTLTIRQGGTQYIEMISDLFVE